MRDFAGARCLFAPKFDVQFRLLQIGPLGSNQHAACASLVAVLGVAFHDAVQALHDGLALLIR